MCRICFILTSLEAGLPWLTMTYRQHKVERLWDPHPQCPWEEMVSMLVWIARALKPIAARGFTHWRLQMHRWVFVAPNESESVKCSPSPISKPIDFALQNPSRAFGLIGKEKHRLHGLHAPILPKCKPIKSQIKGRCHKNSLKRRDCLPYLCLIPRLSKSMVQPHCCCRLTWTQINGIAACRCVGAAEPPWNSLHSIWCPSPLPALHMFLLKALVILDPNSSNSKRSAPMKMERIVGGVSRKFFWSVEMEQPLLVAKLTRAEINGFRAGRCVWRPPSRHEILFVPYDVHLRFLLFTCFSCKILSYLNQIHPNSKRSATY